MQIMCPSNALGELATEWQSLPGDANLRLDRGPVVTGRLPHETCGEDALPSSLAPLRNMEGPLPRGSGVGKVDMSARPVIRGDLLDSRPTCPKKS